jgi:chromosome segregation ATPase
MRSHTLRLALSLTAILLASAGASAESDTDRLREALRAATMQARSLEDERTALQARLAAAESEKATLKTQVEAARGETQQIEKQHREAVDEFNQRLAERDETLEKWKAAYEEAAGVARAKDAERAKFEGEAGAYKTSTKNCLAKNAQLVKIGRELLDRYEALTIGDMIAAREPLFGFGRVEVENLLQDSTDKILDQKAAQ